MAERHRTGVLDTCTYIDLGLLEPERLPMLPALTAVSLAELQQGVAMARDPLVRAARMEKLGAAVADFEPLPFDGDAAARYGTLAALVVAARRDPRPRRMDLMIASIASVRGLPLFTRNPDDFKGLEHSVTVIGL
ncbi:twitching motility protein PilT [Streptomyces violaceoruber]|uniref:Twitching motility protein PilT n=2 Tax=Streptomyces TaxID=1883 RepID=A0A1V0UML3_STRVN|nr:twitching motility protein PilT [Streptomyces violaceoruber]KOG79898.1 twitching motility protein PilT [Streptomyces griseus subsp. rhodochrous]QRV32168.1 type II toxin-antitoxin system VapC family toxin [Streptomyces californicus]QRV38682.1 type II toxin-antitoxin system VapC family toxin [Streptomyces californicus]QRV45585.1 type II toxin-antitoxin system VapC family toxin [Streptomyces californicus]